MGAGRRRLGGELWEGRSTPGLGAFRDTKRGAVGGTRHLHIFAPRGLRGRAARVGQPEKLYLSAISGGTTVKRSNALVIALAMIAIAAWGLVARQEIERRHLPEAAPAVIPAGSSIRLPAPQDDRPTEAAPALEIVGTITDAPDRPARHRRRSGR